MYRTMLKSKIHRAMVTQTDPRGVGAVILDEELMGAADLLPGEQVSIADITNGARLQTYVIKGERGSGVLGIDGAAAHLMHPGDLVVLVSYGQMDAAEAVSYEPRIVFVDGANHIVEKGVDAGFAAAGSGLLSGTVALPPDDDTATFPVAETVDAVRLDALLHAES